MLKSSECAGTARVPAPCLHVPIYISRLIPIHYIQNLTTQRKSCDVLLAFNVFTVELRRLRSSYFYIIHNR